MFTLQIRSNIQLALARIMHFSLQYSIMGLLADRTPKMVSSFERIARICVDVLFCNTG